MRLWASEMSGSVHHVTEEHGQTEGWLAKIKELGFV
jgi:hypothetical protein